EDTQLDMLMDKAATTIQATWRGHLTRKQIMTEQAAAVTIQAAWRRYIAREYRAMQRQEEAAQIIQAHYRGYMTRQALAECQQAATTIQAHWRGYCTRRDLIQHLHGRVIKIWTLSNWHVLMTVAVSLGHLF
uniref:Uncharacterized protein n=1 Tax=Naja naja TaxID=35670 RepID=A0A8C6XR69_NAJNA